MMLIPSRELGDNETSYLLYSVHKLQDSSLYFNFTISITKAYVINGGMPTPKGRMLILLCETYTWIVCELCSAFSLI